MNFKIEHQILDPTNLNFFKEELDLISCQVDEVIVHKGHIPKFGIIILEDPVYACLKKERVLLPKFSVHGADELYSNQPLSYSIMVSKGSKFLLLDRTTILAGMSDNKNTSNIFKSILVLG